MIVVFCQCCTKRWKRENENWNMRKNCFLYLQAVESFQHKLINKIYGNNVLIMGKWH